MTQNQIAYWSNVETKRSNQAREAETTRSNKEREKETYRHNIVTEVETNRHNIVTENETERHNRATEQLGTAQLAEQQRHNMATEFQNDQALQETHRANIAKEGISQQQISLGYAQVGATYAQIAEAARHNQASELLNLMDLNTRRDYNDTYFQQSQAKLDETMRSNLANEQQRTLDSMLNYSINKGRNNESVTHNRNTEELTKRGQNFQLLGSLSATVSKAVSGAGITLIGGN